MAETNKRTCTADWEPKSEGEEILETISVKVPRWIVDEAYRICRATGLGFSDVIRTELKVIARITRQHFKRGPALEPFLEHLEIQTEQYDLFFGKRK